MSKRSVLLKMLEDEDLDPDEVLRELLFEDEARPRKRSGGVYRDWIDMILFHKMYEQEVNRKIKPIYEELKQLREQIEKEDPVERELRHQLYQKILNFLDKFNSFAEAFLNLMSPFSFSGEKKEGSKNKGGKVEVKIY